MHGGVSRRFQAVLGGLQGLPGASRRFQALPGASRGLQGLPRASNSEKHCFEQKNVLPKPRTMGEAEISCGMVRLD